MDRYAIFVDAGYLYAEGGKLCCRTSRRPEFNLDVEGMLATIVERAGTQCRRELLRIYWYDGAPDRKPTPVQKSIAALANVKLRLGELSNTGQQKGVDALIFRDLMTLARERAIVDAFLLAGDEDLREGVKFVQDQGVRLTLIGIPSEDGQNNQSEELVFESDELIVLQHDEIRPYFTSLLPGQPPNFEARNSAEVGELFARWWLDETAEPERQVMLQQRPVIPGYIDSALLRVAEQSLGRPVREGDKVPLRGAFWETIDTGGYRDFPEQRPRAPKFEAKDAAEAGDLFARRWLEDAGEPEFLAVISQRPVIPRHIDSALLRSAEQSLGRPVQEGDKVPLRGAFWRVLRNRA